MRNGKCPRCNSATVHAQNGGLGITEWRKIHVYTGAISTAVPYVSFVCVTCGYFENYIADPGKLAQVAKTWQKVPE
jgi:hypothetical protein